MSDDSSRQTIIDEEHLKLLSLGFMVSAALNAFGALAGLFYLAVGIGVGTAISHIPPGATNQGPPQLFFWFFGALGALFFVGFLALGALKLRAAFCIKQRKSRTFCMVIAAITCLGIPLGTILGVFTFIILGRSSVIRLFGETPPAPASFQPSQPL